MISERMLHTLVIFLKANLYWIAVQNTEFSNQNRVDFLKLIPYRDKIIIIKKNHRTCNISDRLWRCVSRCGHTVHVNPKGQKYCGICCSAQQFTYGSFTKHQHSILYSVFPTKSQGTLSQTQLATLHLSWRKCLGQNLTKPNQTIDEQIFICQRCLICLMLKGYVWPVSMHVKMQAFVLHSTWIWYS